MDHDKMLMQVQHLLKFRDDAKEAIEFFKVLKAGNGSMPVPAQSAPVNATGLTDEQLESFRASINAHLDEVTKESAGSFSDRLTKIEDRLAAIEDAPKTDADLQARIETMLTWFDANQQGLETLLAIGDDLPADDPPNADVSVGAAGAGVEASSGAAPKDPAAI